MFCEICKRANHVSGDYYLKENHNVGCARGLYLEKL